MAGKKGAKSTKSAKNPTGTPRERDLIKGHWGWKAGEFKRAVRDTSTGSNYGWLRIGNEKFLVTERMGKAVLKDIQRINMEAKMGLISKEALARKKREINEDMVRDIGKTSVLFENLTDKTGINALFRENVKLTKGQRAELKRFTENIKLISENKELSSKFYKSISSQFKSVTDMYKKFLEQGYTLSTEDIDNLMASVKMINERADSWLGKAKK